MLERRSTLAEVAERMRVSPRWLRERINRMPVAVGDRFGRLWTFTAAQERALIDLLRQEDRAQIRIGRAPKARRSLPADDALAEAMRLATEKPPRAAKPRRGPSR